MTAGADAVPGTGPAPETAAGTVADTAAEPAVRRRRRWPGAVVLVVLVALVGALFAGRFDAIDPAPSALTGRPAPPLQGETLAGDRFDLADWRGDVVLVNVWASWCLPCRQEHPLLTETAAELGSQGLRVVGINVGERRGDAQAFLDRYGGAAWPHVVDDSGALAVEWGTFALPETYLVDRDGTVVAKAVGELDAEWIADTVVPLLEEGGP